MAGKKKKDKAAAPGELLNVLGGASRAARTMLGRQLLDHGLYAGQDSLMLLLDGADGLAPGAIAEALGVRAPTVTKMISRLEAQGLVQRQASPEDGRMALVTLTQAGREKTNAVSKARKMTEKAALKDFRKKDVRQFLEMLSVIESNLDASMKKPGKTGRPTIDPAEDTSAQSAK